MKQILRSNYLCVFFAIVLIFSLFSCKSKSFGNVQNGDLLFITAKNSGLSGAINNVTQKTENASFDHIGLVEKNRRGIFVLHAAPKGGSQKQTLKQFLKDQSAEEQTVVLYRLKPEYQKSISGTIAQAEKMLGKPYNFDYILNENRFYCSDFIERAFRKHHIFQLEPMTFVDPSTGKTNAFWEKFYAEKNLRVPEGEPGCNPNGLAASEKLMRIKVLK